MSSNRRKFIALISSSMVCGGVSTSTVSAQKTNPVSHLHEDDWFSVDKEIFNKDKTLKQTAKRSPAIDAERHQDEVYIFINEEYIKERYLNDVESDTSLSAQVAKTPEGRKQREKHNRHREQVQSEIQESLRTTTRSSAQELSHENQVTVHSSSSKHYFRLGRDISITSCDVSDDGTSGFWGDKESEGRLSDDEIHCEAEMAPMTITSNSAWAWIGKVVRPYGSGSESATITADVDHTGHIWAATGGSASAEITLGVYNDTDDNIEKETLILSEHVSAYINDYEYIRGSSDDALHVDLEGYKDYRVYVKLEASGTGAPTGGFRSDLGENMWSSWNGNHGVQVNKFEINF